MKAKPIKSYSCPGGCKVTVSEIGYQRVRISRSGKVFMGYEALGKALGLGRCGAKNRIKMERCICINKATAYFLAREAREERPPEPKTEADPLVTEFLRIIGKARPGESRDAVSARPCQRG